MRIVLTGASGFIGKRIEKILLNKHEVITIGRNGTQYIADITDEERMSEVAEKIAWCDIVVHAAAKISFDNYDVSLIENNIIGTLNVAKLSEKIGAKQIIFLSSIPILGNANNAIINGNEKDCPKSLYHVSKLSAELVLNLFRDKYKVCELRLASPIDTDIPENRMLSIFIRKALNGERIYLNGKGKRIQTYTSTIDIANIVLRCIEEKSEGKFLVPGEQYSNYEIAQMCIEICESRSEIILEEEEVFEDSERWIVSNKLFDMLEYNRIMTVVDVLKGIKDRMQ